MVVTRRMSKQKLEFATKKVHEKTRQFTIQVIRLSSQEIERATQPVMTKANCKAHRGLKSLNLPKKISKIKADNGYSAHAPSTSYNLRKKVDSQLVRAAAPAPKIETPKAGKKVNAQRQNPKTNKDNGQSADAPSTSYSLRKKINSLPAPATAPARKTSNAIVKVNSQCPKTLWNELKKSRTGIPAKNTIIISKMRSYTPWPSKLVSIKGGQALVYFFGTGQHGEVKSDEIIPFEDGLLLLKLYSLKKIKDFRRAVREAEVFLNIPSDKSILNN